MIVLNIFLFLALSLYSVAQDTQKPVSAIKETHKEAQASQKKVNKLDDETKQLLQKYRKALSRTESLRVYKEQLRSYIKGQKKEMLEMRKKIEEVKDTRREITPLMLRMMDSLERFVLLDAPFLPDERKKRIQELKGILSRSDVSVSEKYRQLISAYKLEQDYGRTMQSWREMREIDGKKLTVEYLRLGRVALIYKSLDGRHLAYWDQKSRTWKKLPKSYRKDVAQAIKMALKQAPPNLVKLPVPTPDRKESP